MPTLGVLQMSDNGVYASIHTCTSYYTFQALKIVSLCCFTYILGCKQALNIDYQLFERFFKHRFSYIQKGIKGVDFHEKHAFSYPFFPFCGSIHIPITTPNTIPNTIPNPNFPNETYRLTSYPTRPFTTSILPFPKAHLTGD